VGITQLKAWASAVPYPIVAIGGITEENISNVVAAKAASGIAMISGVLDGEGNISKERTKVLIKALTKKK
jgi:thiamine-phosphate pyrophosphorylase/hydroxymethylpyrimidine kinase/phosphomethylpyrimidine kinase/thiamine-phosphate diphosphorylase